MAIRRILFRWLTPAALILPLWLVIGWAIFNAASAPWVLLPVLLIFCPAVFIGQLIATVLTRVRPSVREQRAVSWADVAVFVVWHALTIAVGFYNEQTFGIMLPLAIVAGVLVLVVTGSQLWREGRESRSPLIMNFSRGAAADDVPFASPHTTAGGQPVIIVNEATARDND